MAALRPSPLLPQSLPSSSSSSTTSQSRITATALSRTARKPLSLKTGCHGGTKKTLLARRGRLPCMPTKEEVGAVGGTEDEEERYLTRTAGWGVRRMGRVGEEMRRVALVQAEAFHVPVALFNDFFFDFFKAEVLAALIYKLRNSPPDRYACLVAEEADAATQLLQAPFENIIGVVDCTVQDEGDILSNLQGVQEYFYVSGIAVLPSFRRRKVGTALLKACEVLALEWRQSFMALRAYEDDRSARGLYSKAGYRVVSRDPGWVTWVGRRRRVLMIKDLPIHDPQVEQQ
ncbi:GCN5-related N-acetyltransferase 10, chloroplastic [Lolium perenne]|uniref:GCN5-related N-acetyltransferase 10, chloroplastic n=1 Tax=Lolium perenne TaxID=4522 RepID=UPI0021EB4D76|nr:uncharacterized protein LOC127293937 [Lolium perenne]